MQEWNFTGPVIVVLITNLTGWIKASMEDYSYETQGYAFWKAIQPYDIGKGLKTLFEMGLWWMGLWLTMQGFNVNFAPLAASGGALIAHLLPQIIKKIGLKWYDDE